MSLHSLLLSYLIYYPPLEAAHRTTGLRVGLVTRLSLPLAFVPLWDADNSWRGGVFVAASLAFWVLFHAENTFQQARRDKWAHTILVLARGGSFTAPSFALYLRPFATTNRLATQGAGPAYDEVGSPIHVDLETVFEMAVRPMRLVGLGRPGEMLGAARVESKAAEWLDDFAALARFARMIVVFPSDSAGITLELQWLITHGGLPRCVFVMPETHYGERNHADEWARTVRACTQHGLSLPAYDRKGMLFTLNAHGRVSRFRDLNFRGTLLRVQRIRHAIELVLPGVRVKR